MRFFSYTTQGKGIAVNLRVLMSVCLGAIVLILSPITISHTGVSVDRAHAQVYRVVEVGQRLSDGAATLSSVMGILGVNQSVATKELQLDGIAYKLMQEVLSKQTSDMLNQIISGFDGDPAFIQSYNRLYADAADAVFEDFIDGDTFGNVCAPFKNDVQQSLNTQYQQSKGGAAGGTGGTAEKFRCSLDESAADAFIGGEHVSGTWNQWHELTTKPKNNPYGQRVLNQYEANRRIAAAQQDQRDNALASSGFKSKQECVEVNGRQVCNITLPGKLALERAADVLNLGDQALLQADEINEVISSLLSKLGNQAFSGANGLLGLADNTDGNGSYLQNLANNTTDVTGVSDRSQNPIQLALNAENAVIGLHDEIRASIDAIRARFNSDSVNASVNCPDLEFPSELNRQYASSTRVTADGTAIVTVLEGLNQRYNTATSAISQLAVYSEFLNLEQSGFVTNIVNVALIPFVAQEVDEIIAAFSAEIDQECVLDNTSFGDGVTDRGGGGDF